MIKKLTGIICILCLLFSLFTTPAVLAADYADTPHILNAKEFLSQLKINGGIESENNEYITRAEFAAMVARLLNITLPDKESHFTDLTECAFEKEINLLYEMGITNGTSETTFTPEGKVSRAVAAKMLVSAMEYDTLASALGGYPSGYLYIANQCRLFKNLPDTEDAIRVGEAYMLIYNALISDKAIVKGVSGDETQYETISGRNILTDNFGLESIEGTVNAAGLFAVRGENARSGKIGVGNSLFDTDLETEGYLGMKVTLWYDAENQKVYGIIKKPQNSSVTIKAEDILNYSENQLSVDEEEGKTKKYLFDKGFTYIENGRGENFSPEKILFDSGNVTLLDNDGDKDIDFVIAEKTEYFVISAADFINGVIYDSASEIKEIKYTNDTDKLFTIFEDGKKISFADLKENMVLSVLKSSDEKICRIEASSKYVEGRVDEISDDTVMVGKEEYRLNSYFKKSGVSISVGDEYRLLLADDNTVASIVSKNNSGFKYAMFLGYDEGESIRSAKIKILKDNNTISVMEMAKRITLNGEMTDSKSTALKNLLVNGSTPLYQLIRYKETNGILTAIDTQEKSLTKWDFESERDINDSLTKYLENKNLYYYGGGYNYGSPGVSFAGALIIRVPENYDDGMSEISDEEFFVMSSSSLDSDIGYYADVYDFDDMMSPAVILIREKGKVDDVKIPPRGNKSYVVLDIVEAIDEEGERVKKIKLFHSDLYEEYFIKNELFDKMRNKPQKGDVVRFTKNALGYIDGLCIDVDYSFQNGEHSFNVYYGENNVQTDAHHYFTYYTGKVYNANDSALVISIKDHPGGSYWYSIPGGIMRVGLISPVYIEYNTTTGEAKAIKASMLKSIKNSGEDAAHAVALRMVYGCANTIIAYTK